MTDTEKLKITGMRAALLAAKLHGGTGERWQLVPKEPTEEMGLAGCKSSGWPNDVYRAMLAAAPSSSLPPSDAQVRETFDAWTDAEYTPHRISIPLAGETVESIAKIVAEHILAHRHSRLVDEWDAGATAMREACAAELDRVGNAQQIYCENIEDGLITDYYAANIRSLPLPARPK
jgi:hypothetical protein